MHSSILISILLVMTITVVLGINIQHAYLSSNQQSIFNENSVGIDNFQVVKDQQDGSRNFRGWGGGGSWSSGGGFGGGGASGGW
ncbi:hypothetical protein I4U23_011290 [Adineta vaga]|nr:hypothetical protein I4U23_011290 [Adineta vaga]